MKRFLILSLLLILGLGANAQDNKIQDVYSLALHSPEYMNSYISVSVVFNQNTTAFISYNDDKRTPVKLFNANEPQDFVLAQLDRKGKNTYKLHYSFDGGETILESSLMEFVYPSKNVEEFCFTVSSFSSAIKDGNSGKLLTQLNNINAKKPLFHIDLGGSFDVVRYGENFESSVENYVSCRNYLGLVSSCAPLYLAVGRYDGEGDRSEARARKWSHAQKSKYFPTVSENYYSFTYGDALIIVLDPHAFTPAKVDTNPWLRTLGKVQFDWLKNEVKQAKKTNTFVIVHDILGDSNPEKLYEWGGYNETNSFDFNAQRKGWKKPIHTILKESGVSSVFYKGQGKTTTKNVDGVNYIAIGDNEFFSVGISKEGVELDK